MLDFIKECVTGSVLFPFSNYLLNRKGILRKYRSFLTTEYYTPEELQQIQLQKMRQVLRYAYTWVPFYKDRFDAAGFKPDDIQSLADVQNIPPLTRADVIEHAQELVDKRLADSVTYANETSKKGPGEPIPFARFKKHKLVRNTSSGSTGAPTVFYEDGSITAANWANELRLRNWFGIHPGAKEARLTRIATAYMPGNKTIVMRQFLWNQLILPGVNLLEKDYALCLNKLIAFRPKVLWGFTSSLAGFAQYCKDTNVRLPSGYPKLCITWAAPLYEHERNILQETFNCPVTNVYGSREVGHIAAICPEGSLHVNQESLFIETEKQMQGIAGGEILATTLEKTPMPFIRYRMGDLGEISDAACACGRSLQVINRLHGRTGEIFITKEGRMLSPNFWCRTFMNTEIAGAIKRFQVIYQKNKDIQIDIVKTSAFTDETQSTLKKFLNENFSEQTRVTLQYVQKIEPMISGKYQMVINKAKNSMQ